MSDDPEQDYFADGMVDEIITGLSRIKWLSVISRNSTFIHKDKPVAIREIASKLGVGYVLEGGVRKSGNRVRITAQLIDTKTDAHLWAEQYDRVLEDVFALQDEITMCVIGAIEPSLRKAEIDRVKRQRPSNLNAYDLVLRSLPLIFAMVPKDAEIAIPLLENAVKLQPDYGAAYAFLGWCYHHRFVRGGMHEEDRATAIQHARAAIAHGSDDATALAVAAHVIIYLAHDTVTAFKLFDRALELSSSNVFALNLNAIALAWMGKAELAIERAEQAIRLSPFNSSNFRSHHARRLHAFPGGATRTPSTRPKTRSTSTLTLVPLAPSWRPHCCGPDARRKPRPPCGPCWNANRCSQSVHSWSSNLNRWCLRLLPRLGANSAGRNDRR